MYDKKLPIYADLYVTKTEKTESHHAIVTINFVPLQSIFSLQKRIM